MSRVRLGQCLRVSGHEHTLFLFPDRKVLAALEAIPWVFGGASWNGAGMPRFRRLAPVIGP
jgi:hypothetical protein